ncbi:hypothetical protein FAZ19_07800 [Sphingobacterium alkalisoli]|uniref:Uncharacterized protein n=1 Tax=Sphingobacterium alkalisoli TaxID=1874115 RepID=A0A4U0H598_9SPHI|nr:hypothetical protein [Sphingobacterium alkalisoli]TJY66808.1 hypothetical protein FAZ19_07800 [Sphingobacterium alkalisoli]GGH14080.1 hypothetical protein GCM10011418_14740 [Sphingobacterium alkalisoli]
MDFNRKFQHNVDGRTITFDVTYDPKTHFFTVLESGLQEGYLLKFDMNTREWRTENGPQSQIPVGELAILVQKSFGHFV